MEERSESSIEYQNSDHESRHLLEHGPFLSADRHEDAAALLDYSLENGGSPAAYRDSPSTDIREVLENFHLQRGAAEESIMQLQMCINDEVVSEGDGIHDVYLVGQSVRGSSEIHVLAEKFTLNLHPNYAPRFLVKTAGGWILLQKPKTSYRRLMIDALTLAHFLHYVRKYPSSPSDAMKELYLTNEFGKFGEQPSVEKVADFFPVIKRFIQTDMEVKMTRVLREFFPNQFRDGAAPHPVRKMRTDIWQEQKWPQNGINIDLNREIPDEGQDHEKQGANCSFSPKTSKVQRRTVQAELRNLHSKWCSLLAGRAIAKQEKNMVSKKSHPSERHRPEMDSVPSLESKTSTLKQQKKSKPTMAVKLKEEAQKSRVKTMCLKQKKVKQSVSYSGKSAPDPSPRLNATRLKGEVRKSTVKAGSLKRKKEFIEESDSDSESSGPCPKTRAGVHSPSRDMIDQLEDPPICTICDDGGDLICCEGPCHRRFHATKGADTSCSTLRLTLEQLEKIDKYYCKNCLLRQHQCFICEELGSSAPSLLGHQKVYMCDAPGCRKFYHANCVAKTVDPALDWIALADRIKRGLHGFLCPRHSCVVCAVKEIQPGCFVQCRRCPKAWHRDCLTDFSNSGELPTTSIWKHYGREFIYCREHRILDDIQTPEQDHLRFPK